jgi:hypothetical protein
LLRRTQGLAETSVFKPVEANSLALSTRFSVS